MSRRVAYLDASALVKLVSREAESAALAEFVAAFAHRATSRLAVVEMTRAAALKGERALAQVAALLSAMAFVEFDDTLAEAAAAVPPSSLRSLDAIHLASAMAVREALDVVVTYDARLADAARAAGFEVLAPG